MVGLGDFGIKIPGLGDLGNAAKERIVLEKNSGILGHDLPKISFDVVDGQKVNGKDTKNFSAALTEEQTANFTKIVGKLSGEEIKALFGNLDFQFQPDAPPAKTSHLILKDAARFSQEEINGMNRENNGSKKALHAILIDGNEEAAKAALKPIVDKQHNAPEQAPSSPAPAPIDLNPGAKKTSQAQGDDHIAAAPLDLGKLADAGFKVASAAASVAAEPTGSGLEAVAKVSGIARA